MAKNELERYLELWEIETHHTLSLLRALPAGSYDFRPYPEGRSIGEMAWHLAEVEAYMTLVIEQGGLSPGARPGGIERPRAIEELAPAFERVHADAVARVKKLTVEDLDRSVGFFGDRQLSIRNILQIALLDHGVHHRGQLVLMVRMAGGVPPGLYGPTREETAAARERVKAQAKA